MRPALTEIADLETLGLTAAKDRAPLEAIAAEFRLRVTAHVQDTIQDPSDPIAQQYLPDLREAVIRPEELFDPIGDAAHEPVHGLTHRYTDRVIFHITKTCEVYCRFCFRRETVGETGVLTPAQIEAALDYLRRTPSIHEVILTGGDPMSLSARRLKDLIADLSAIAHLGLIRLHSRVPVVAPHRIDRAMLEALTPPRDDLAIWVVIHTNHAQELVPEATASFSRMRAAGIGLLSQSVLLRGINDSSDALSDLFRGLLRHGVKPYYLHHCDLARGTSHFRTTLREGMALIASLRGKISGTALPHYVLDIPGGHGKVPVSLDYFTDLGEGSWQVLSPKGTLHSYQDPERP